MKKKNEIYRKSNKFYKFESLKLIAKSKNFRTDFEKIQFFENVKMEFDIGSSFCKAHINVIKKCKKYLLDFEFDESQQCSDEKKNIDFEIRNRFTLSHHWNLFFYSELDYNTFVENLVNFFSGFNYNENLKIKIKSTTFGNLSKILHDIYFDCSLTKCLKKDKKFLLLVKNLSLYSDLSSSAIYSKLVHL